MGWFKMIKPVDFHQQALYPPNLLATWLLYQVLNSITNIDSEWTLKQGFFPFFYKMYYLTVLSKIAIFVPFKNQRETMQYSVKELLEKGKLLQEVTVQGWVRTFRSNRFIALNDGSTIHNIQCVVDFENMESRC